MPSLRLSLGAGLLRGHARHSRAAHWVARSAVCRTPAPGITALPGSVRCRPVSGHGGVPPCPGAKSVVERRRQAASVVGARPLQPPASLLHKAPFCQACASRYAKASLGVTRRCAPFGFTKQALCKVAFAGGGCVSRRCFPVALRPAHRQLGTRVVSCLHGIGQALRAVFMSVAFGHVMGVCPRPPRGALPLRGCGSAR